MKNIYRDNYTDAQVKFILDQRKTGRTWELISESFNKKFAQEKTANAVRKIYHRYQDYDLSQDEMLVNIQASHSIRKAKSRLEKEKKLILDQWELNQNFMDEFKEALEASPIKIHKPVKLAKQSKIKRVVFMHLSDLHIHAFINKERMGGINSYGPEEEARRLALFCTHVANYKKAYRKETELVIAMNGDLGQGIIHDQESVPAMATQFSAMLHLLSQAISFLGQEYASVRIICTQDNHLRFIHKGNKGRQTNSKFDGFHTMLHTSLKYALKEFKNVRFEIPATPYAHIDILGHKFLILHGDTVLSAGNVGKNISTESIKNKVNDMIAGLGKIDVVVMGHLHVATYTTLNNGTELIVNGSMSGIDEFCQSIGILKNIPSQQMFEVTEKYAVGDMRFVRLAEADKQVELEKIITPFKRMF